MSTPRGALQYGVRIPRRLTLNTLLVSILAIVLSSVLGTAIGAAQLSSDLLVRKLASGYVDIVRNVPPLVQLFFWYFVALRALPPVRTSWSLFDLVFVNNRGINLPAPEASPDFWWVVAGLITALVAARPIFRATRSAVIAAAPVFIVPIALFFLLGKPLYIELAALRGFNFQGGMKIAPELIALVLTLTFYQASYIAETVRSGISSVPSGQIEAARSLGLRNFPAFRFVTFPQALRVSLPPLTNTYVNTIKASTIASAIAYPDLASVFAGTVLNLTGQALEIMLVTAGVYIAITAVASTFIYAYERRLASRSQ